MEIVVVVMSIVGNDGGTVGVSVACYGKCQQERELEETGDKPK